MLVLRPAVAGDAAAISAVIAAAVRVTNAADYPQEVIERVAAGFRPEAVADLIARRRVVAAVERGTIVGTAALDGAIVRSVFVRPNAQGRGTGSALMAEIVRMALQDGYSALRLRSTPSARSFYERHGFVALGDAWFGEERTIAMERDLRQAFAPARRM